MKTRRAICLHGHFYQPPRENPWTGVIERQESAQPYHDWNERITQECYRPITHFNSVNLLSSMSFDFGPTLLNWLIQRAPEVYDAILSADKLSQIKFSGHGSALACAYNHLILPLANARDKKTQIIWGLHDFERRFHRRPEGMWLPETAVDLESLSLMAGEGVLFTILSPTQAIKVKARNKQWMDVQGGKIDPRKSYRVSLPSGKSMAVFFYDGPISQDVAFDHILDAGDSFLQRLQGAFIAQEKGDQLVSLATDGETYGHHKQGRMQALFHVIESLQSSETETLTNYGEFLAEHPPEDEVEIYENSSWSCCHGVERWKNGCGCNSGQHQGWNQNWRAPLREALDYLRDEILPHYENLALKFLKDPWAARDEALDIFMDHSSENLWPWVERWQARRLSEQEAKLTFQLMELQKQTMLMYTSCGWFFDDIGGLETVQILQYACRAIELAHNLFQIDYEPEFLKKLKQAKSNDPSFQDGELICRRLVLPSKFHECPFTASCRVERKDKPREKVVAYFSMEVGLENIIPSYSGGLGILAGDTLKAAADRGLPMVGMSLLYRKGYFQQELDDKGQQTELPVEWHPEASALEKFKIQTSIILEGREVHIHVWRYLVRGFQGHEIPVYFLDTDLEQNVPEDRQLTDTLYGGDDLYRLRQEALLGFGGIAALRAIGVHQAKTYHMNEGHSAFLTLALLKERAKETKITEEMIQDVRQHCVFTTHTPVPAGHDQFPLDQVRRVIGDKMADWIRDIQCCSDPTLNMTYLALFFSRYINGVAMRHRQVSRSMFPHYPINSITNGVHATTWVSPHFQTLFDHHLPEWRVDNFYLRHAIEIPIEEIQAAHLQAKHDLLARVRKETEINLETRILTIGFARRATAYKRLTFLFSSQKRLEKIVRDLGPLQIIFAGKAHPADKEGKALIQKIFEITKDLKDRITVVYLKGYDMTLAKLLCSGVDLWLNTPHKPQEASGTSGMKAALNGVPSLSVLDGWWVEGHLENITGWSIGSPHDTSNALEESDSLYNKLESIILPTYYQAPQAYGEIMRSTIAHNGSFFNTQRMLDQYVKNAYGLP